MPQTLLLTIGRDVTLLSTRTAILRQAGYIVQPVSSLREAVAQFAEGEFDIVLVCHSVPAKDRESLTSFVRARSPLTQLLQIATLDFETDTGADATVSANPEALLEGVAAALSSRTQSKRGVNR